MAEIPVTGIVAGQPVQPAHILNVIETLTGSSAYSVTMSSAEVANLTNTGTYTFQGSDFTTNGTNTNLNSTNTFIDGTRFEVTSNTVNLTQGITFTGTSIVTFNGEVTSSVGIYISDGDITIPSDHLLIGTSSQALTASYISTAQTASYVLPLAQDVEITGSLIVSGGSFTSNGLAYPEVDGTSGQVIVTDSNGVLSMGDGERLVLQVRNDEGSDIDVGCPIYSKGEVGSSGRIKVGKADASDPAKMPSIGVLQQTLTNGADGYAVATGILNENISGFTGLSLGDTVYVAVGGDLTTAKPTGSALIQNVGIILRTNGSIIQGLKVSAIGRTNDVPNITSGYAWVGNSDGVATPTLTSSFVVTTANTASYIPTVDGFTVEGNGLTVNNGGLVVTQSAQQIADFHSLNNNVGRISITNAGGDQAVLSVNQGEVFLSNGGVNNQTIKILSGSTASNAIIVSGSAKVGIATGEGNISNDHSLTVANGLTLLNGDLSIADDHLLLGTASQAQNATTATTADGITNDELDKLKFAHPFSFAGYVGDGAVSIGNSNKLPNIVDHLSPVTEAYYSLAVGTNNKYTSTSPIAFSVLVGENNEITGSAYNILVAGKGNIVDSTGMTAVGRFSKPTGTGTTGGFVIGNGTSTSNRSNLLLATGDTVQITGSLDITGSITSSGDLSIRDFSSVSASLAQALSGGGGGGSTDTGSLLTTASVALNTITFTKGDTSTFNITVDTGSGGGSGAGFPFEGDAVITGSLTVSGSGTSTQVLGGLEVTEGLIVSRSAQSVIQARSEDSSTARITLTNGSEDFGSFGVSDNKFYFGNGSPGAQAITIQGGAFANNAIAITGSTTNTPHISLGLAAIDTNYLLGIYGDVKMSNSRLRMQGASSVVEMPTLPTSDPGNLGQLFVTQSNATGTNLDGQYVVLQSRG